MKKLALTISFVAVVLVVSAGQSWGQGIEIARYEQEFSSVRLEPVRLDGRPGIALFFEGSEDLHYYARAETAPWAGAELTIKPESGQFDFGEAISSKWSVFVDPLGNKVEVYAGAFTVFLPIKGAKETAEPIAAGPGEIEVAISGVACTSHDG